MTKEEKLKKLKDSAVKNIQKKHGENSYFFEKRVIPKVPLLCSSGSISLDNALVIGGFPRGRLIEVFGQESCSKTTLTLIQIAECQKQGMVCAFLDVEQSFDPTYATNLGVNVNELFVGMPETTEETFSMVLDLIESGAVDYIVVDSTNAMLPRIAFEKEVGESIMGKNSVIFSNEIPKISGLCNRNNCTVTLISQIRQKIGVMFGSDEKVGVGNTVKFTASVRIKVSKSEVKKDDGEEGQSQVTIKSMVVKNKVGAPYRKGEFILLTGGETGNEFGIDKYQEVFDFGVKYEFIKKAGAWFTLENEERLQGSNNVKKYLKENLEIYEELRSKVYAKIDEEREKASLISEGSFNDKKAEVLEEKENTKKATRKKKEEPVTIEAEATVEE